MNTDDVIQYIKNLEVNNQMLQEGNKGLLRRVEELKTENENLKNEVKFLEDGNT